MITLPPYNSTAGRRWTLSRLGSALVAAPCVAPARKMGRLFSDIGKTNAVATDGSKVRAIVDPITGEDWTCGSDAARWTLRGSGRVWWLDPEGVTTGYDGPAQGLTEASPLTAAAAVRPSNPGAAGCLWAWQQFGTAPGGQFYLFGGKAQIGAFAALYPPGRLIASAVAVTGTDSRLTGTYDGTGAAAGYSLRLDSASLSPTVESDDSPGAFGNPPLRFGYREGFLYSFAGRWYGGAFVKRVLSAGELRSLDRFLRGLMP